MRFVVSTIDLKDIRKGIFWDRCHVGYWGCQNRPGKTHLIGQTVDVVRVPGAYEIPVVAEKMASSGKYDALIVLGVVVEGETQHAQMIIDTTGQSILDISCRHRIPVINEIVGVRNWAQAEARCLGGENTRGWYAAEAAVETARVYKQL